MKQTSRIATLLLLAGGLVLVSAPAVNAAPDRARGPDNACLTEMGPRGMNGHHRGEAHDRDAHPFKGLDLTEAQQDKLFAIGHGLAPAKRDYHKELRKLREQQRALVQSSGYDSAKMKQLVAQETQLTAAHRLQMADARHQMFAVLTDAQQQEWTQRQQARTAHPDR